MNPLSSDTSRPTSSYWVISTRFVRSPDPALISASFSVTLFTCRTDSSAMIHSTSATTRSMHAMRMRMPAMACIIAASIFPGSLEGNATLAASTWNIFPTRS